MRNLLQSIVTPTTRTILKSLLKGISVDNEKLTPSHLQKLGFTSIPLAGHIYWFESGVKERDRVLVEFDETDSAVYRVFHGRDMTFIAQESSLLWFETYYAIIHPDNRNKYLQSK